MYVVVACSHLPEAAEVDPDQMGTKEVLNVAKKTQDDSKAALDRMKKMVVTTEEVPILSFILNFAGRGRNCVEVEVPN